MHRDVATTRRGTVEGRPVRSVRRLMHSARTSTKAAGSRKVLARRGVVLGASVVLFGALHANKSGDSALADAVVIMFVVPVAILALEFGLRGGILGAAVAILLAGAWHSADSGGISDLGYAARALTFLVLGAGIGQVADVRRRLERDLLPRARHVVAHDRDHDPRRRLARREPCMGAGAGDPARRAAVAAASDVRPRRRRGGHERSDRSGAPQRHGQLPQPAACRRRHVPLAGVERSAPSRPRA